MYQLRSFVCNKYKPWFNDQSRGAFDIKQEAHLRWTQPTLVNLEKYIRYQVRANET